MTDTTLPSSVTEAFGFLERNIKYGGGTPCIGDVDIIRAHLSRLAEENARLTEANECYLEGFSALTDSKRVAEAERDALKARIATARRVMLGTYPAHGSGYVQIVSDPANGIGDETFALLKLEGGE